MRKDYYSHPECDFLTLASNWYPLCTSDPKGGIEDIDEYDETINWEEF